MAAPVKTANTTLLAMQSIATGVAVISSAVDVSTKIGAFIGIHYGHRSASSTIGPIFRLEGTYKASGAGDAHWFVLASYQPLTITSEGEAVSGTVAAGQNVITVASTTNLGAGAILFCDNSTIGNSEIVRIKSIVANTSVTAEDNLVNAQTGATLYSGAEIITWDISLVTVQQIRFVVDTYTGPTGQNIAVEVFMSTWDS